MKFIPIGMADMSRRFRPQAGTAGIGTRKVFFDPGRVADAGTPIGVQKGLFDFVTGGIGLTASTTG